MKNYILGIIATAIFCAVTRSLLDEKSAIGQIVRLLGSILLTIAIIVPLKNISFQDISAYFNDITIEANRYAEQGAAYAQHNKCTIIKEQTEAYILDKANRLGLDIAVEVALGEEDMIPNGITITGPVSPYAKEVMGTFVEETLGIAKENQQWN